MKNLKEKGKWKSIKEKESTLSADGLEIQILTSKGLNKDDTIQWAVWDFTGNTFFLLTCLGEDMYAATQQFFVSPRSIFIVLWDMSSPSRFSQLDDQIQTIKSYSGKDTAIVLLGTIMEKMAESKVEQLRGKVQSTYIERYSFLYSFEVDVKGKNVQDVANFMVRLAMEVPAMKDLVPKSFGLLEEAIMKERKKENQCKRSVVNSKKFHQSNVQLHGLHKTPDEALVLHQEFCEVHAIEHCFGETFCCLLHFSYIDSPSFVPS